MQITPAATIPLSEILGSYELGLVLIAGITPQTAEAKVQWVHGSDLKNPAPFLVPRTVLLTTGAQFSEDLSRKEADEYVSELLSTGVAALGFAIDVTHARIPHSLVSSCDSLGLPLFRVPYATPFIQISQAAARMLAAKSYERQSWSLETQRVIARSAISRKTMQGSIDTLAKRLGRWVVLTDSMGEVTQASPDFSVSEATANNLTRAAKELIKKPGQTHTTKSFAGTQVHLQTVPGASKTHGVLAVETLSGLDYAHRTAIELVSSLASFYLENRVSLLNERQTVRNVYASLLFSGMFAEATRVASAARFAEIAGPVTVLNLGRSEKLRERFLEKLFNLSFATAKSLFFEYAAESLVLTTPENAKKFEDLITNSSVYCGSATTQSLTGIAEALQESKVALRHAIKNKEISKIVPFSKEFDGSFMGLFSMDQEAVALARKALLPVTRHDTEYSDELLLTLEVWLKNHGQTSNTAKELGVHRHTVTNRLKILEDLLQLDLADAEVRSELLFSIKLLTNNLSE